MASRSTKNPPRELTELDRAKIAEARGVLKGYGLDDHPESNYPMDDVSYEQRNCRMKALDTAVALLPWMDEGDGILSSAAAIYDYIWEGQMPDA